MRSPVGSFGSPLTDAQLKACQNVRKLKSPDAASTFCSFVVPDARRAHDDHRPRDRLLGDLRDGAGRPAASGGGWRAGARSFRSKARAPSASSCARSLHSARCRTVSGSTTSSSTMSTPATSRDLAMSWSTESCSGWVLTPTLVGQRAAEDVRGPSSVTGTMPGGAAMMSGIRLNRFPAVASRRIEALDADPVPRCALHLPVHVLDVAGQEHALLDGGRGHHAFVGRDLEARAHAHAHPGLEPPLGDQPGLHRHVVDDGLGASRRSGRWCSRAFAATSSGIALCAISTGLLSSRRS